VTAAFFFAAINFCPSSGLGQPEKKTAKKFTADIIYSMQSAIKSPAHLTVHCAIGARERDRHEETRGMHERLCRCLPAFLVMSVIAQNLMPVTQFSIRSAETGVLTHAGLRSPCFINETRRVRATCNRIGSFPDTICQSRVHEVHCGKDDRANENVQKRPRETVENP